MGDRGPGVPDALNGVFLNSFYNLGVRGRVSHGTPIFSFFVPCFLVDTDPLCVLSDKNGVAYA